MEISEIEEVKLTDIKLEGVNVRTDLDTPNSKENLEELAESIKVNGLMQPILLRGKSGKPPYDVIVGQRRFMAHQLLGKNTIKATFSGDIEDNEALLLSLSENICRQELNFTDTQNAVMRLYNSYGKDVHKVKEKLGLSVKMIRSYIKIEEQASDKIKELLQDGKISMADAKRSIDASQGDLSKADTLIDEIVKLTKYEKKRVVEAGKAKPEANAEEIIIEAQKMRVEETIILNLPMNIHKALNKAVKDLSIDAEQITMNLLEDWLKSNDFLLEHE
jgi:ParB family chromosome partitioning protein